MDGNFVFRFEDKPCVCSFCGQPSDDRCLLGYGKKEVAYLCPSCYRTLQDIVELHVDVVRHRDSRREGREEAEGASGKNRLGVFDKDRPGGMTRRVGFCV